MDQQSKAIKSFLLKHIPKHPSDIVAFTVDHFQVTRTTVHRHLNTLVHQRRIIKSGATRSTKYYLSSAYHRELTYKISPQLQEYEVFSKDFDDVFKKIPTNTYDACEYGFTEIFNNAIDHSKGSKIIAETDYDKNRMIISIADDGIGAFKNIMDFFRLDDMRESILQLNKGKMTTDPSNHTGEGIFFCARLFDVFEIYANNLHYIRNNIEDDWSVETISTKKIGTKVVMKISIDATIQLKDLFIKYQNSESLEFARTDIVVQLSKFGEETLIARSQAKRITRGLEKFKYVTLDFQGVRLVGQGFVDEVFRVFSNKYPDMKISYINANEDVTFMIERGLVS